MKISVQPTSAVRIMVADCVSFSHHGQKHIGYVHKKGRTSATVVCDDRREFRVPYPLLRKVHGSESKHVQSQSETLRAQFQVNAQVEFEFKQRRIEGRILRLNPKRAHILGVDEREYQVPYEFLTRLAVSPEQPDSRPPQPETTLNVIAEQARSLLTRHHLAQWSFQFDHGSRRAGCCHYTTQVISMSVEFARHASAQDIQETLLHEIAHALVGKFHNHDAVWQAKAREIGSTGRRCHNLQFTPPRYIVTCERRCWVATVERRGRGLICKHCHSPLVYFTYTADAWEREQAKLAGQQA